MGRNKIKAVTILFFLFFIGYCLYKYLSVGDDEILRNLQPSYIVAFRGNNLPLYGFVKGIINVGENPISEANEISKQISLSLLKRPPMRRDIAVENSLNMHIWDEICCTKLENLWYYPLFPALPSRRLSLPILDLLEINFHSGIRIFGYVLPTKSCKYKFYLYLSNTVGQVWLSLNNEIKNSTLLINASKLSKQKELVSDEIFLKKDLNYFIDVVLKTGKLPGKFSLKWLAEGEATPSDINEAHLQTYFREGDLSHTYLHHESHFKLPMLESRKRLSQLYTTQESEKRFRSFEIPFMLQKDADSILPFCNYMPSYVGINHIKSQYQGVWETHLTSIYPNDQSNVTFQLRTSPNEQLIFGNPLLDYKEADMIANAVFEAIQKKHGGKYKFDSIINIELNSDPPRGKRYLVELKLENEEGKFIRYSEYVFLPHMSKKLCYPHLFKWNKTASVNIILTCGKQGRWVKYFIDSMERLYHETNDRNFNVIIVDFNSNDIDVAKVLHETSLPHYTLLRRTGKFHKTIAIQSATNAIRDNDAIALQVDLHSTIPSNFIELARKHTVKDRMAWSPMLMRLQCGATPQQPYGFWEVSGYGIFSVYKSDWMKFGGMNIQMFLNKWGGEDWDLLDRVLNVGLEVERLKLPNFLHVFHSKKGMWHELAPY